MDPVVNYFINQMDQEKTWAHTDRNLDDHYLMSQDFYRENAFIYDEIPTVCLLQTAIVIPFYLPLDFKPYTIPFHALAESRAAVTFLLSTVRDEVTFSGGFVPEKAAKYPAKRTRCEILVSFIDDTFVVDSTDAVSVLNVAQFVGSRATKPTIDDDWARATGDMFRIYRRTVERSVSVLNSIIMAYAVENTDDRVHPLTLNEIEPVSHFRIVEPETWTTYNWMGVHHTRFPAEDPLVLDDTQVARLYDRAAKRSGSYFEVYEEHYQRALFEYQAGRVGIAVFLLTVSVEVLLTKIVRLDLQKKGQHGRAEIDKTISEATMAKMFTMTSQILGGNCDTKGDSIVGHWYRTAYGLRNRIAHAGYQPEDEEAAEAVRLTGEFHAFIRKQIARAPNKLAHIVAGFYTPHRWTNRNEEGEK